MVLKKNVRITKCLIMNHRLSIQEVLLLLPQQEDGGIYKKNLEVKV